MPPTLTTLFRQQLAVPLTSSAPDLPGLELPPRGWTVTHGVTEVVEPFVVRLPENHEGLAIYEGLDGDAAADLLDRLPEPALSDRQGDGPSLRRALETAAEHPGLIEVHGYVVGPGRWDERITAEAITVRAWTRLRVIDGHGDQCECPVLLDRVRALGLDDALGPPTHVEPERWPADDDGVTGWLLWWD